MFGFLETFNRVVVAFLSGALLIVGTTFWADVIMWKLGKGSAFTGIEEMLKSEQYKVIFIVITALTVYIIGIINFAASSVAFKSLVDTTHGELKLISRIESLRQPQVLKEVVELLHVRRTLLAFAFPLFYFGVGLACDFNERSFSDTVRTFAGLCLIVLAGLAPIFAARMTRLLDRTAKSILAGASQGTPAAADPEPT